MENLKDSKGGKNMQGENRDYYKTPQQVEDIIRVTVPEIVEMNKKKFSQAIDTREVLFYILMRLPKDVVNMVGKKFLFIISDDPLKQSPWISSEMHRNRNIVFVERLGNKSERYIENWGANLLFSVAQVHLGIISDDPNITYEDQLAKAEKQVSLWLKEYCEQETTGQ